MSQNGYLVIADITGYTAFLSQSELEHAEDSLRSLLNLLLENTRPPLVISRLEGDAVISYAPQGSFLQGQTLVEMIENIYIAFRQALERMVLNTTCTCDACRNIHNLDLKFFVHFGTFMLQPLGSHIELIGTDVNLIHRLTKNTITEVTGFKAYAVYTRAAVDALGIQELCDHMTAHVETYEHLGDVTTCVQDMHVVWEREREKRRVVVQSEDAVLTIEHDFSLEPALLWDYVTKPEYKALIVGSDYQKLTGRPNGRTGPGTAYHCAHGNSSTVQTIISWQPFEHYTSEDTSFVPGVTVLSTTWLIPTIDGTRLIISLSKSRGSLGRRLLSDFGLRIVATRAVRKGLQALHDRIEAEMTAGKVAQPAKISITAVEVEAAVAESRSS